MWRNSVAEESQLAFASLVAETPADPDLRDDADGLPPLEPLVYFEADEDHLGGGHCLQLLGGTDGEQHWAIVDQYFTAFDTVATVALTAEREDGDGWRVTRPLLFLAHHLCEVALKAALGPGSYSNDHDLVKLWEVLGPKVPWADDSPVPAWIGEVLKELNGVTARGFEGRYADKPFDERVCCLNLTALTKQVTVLVALLIRMR